MLVFTCAGDIKIMASPERVCSWVDVRKDPQNHLQTSQIPDENTLLSPGEVQIMRNHSKISSKLYSPSRKTSKAKTFTVHGSPQRSTKMSTSAKGSQEKRKTLQVLQPAADGKGLLVGSSGIRREKKGSSKPKAKTVCTQKTLKEFSSSSTAESSDSDSSTPKATQIDDSTDIASNEAFALMVQDPPPENYWQMLAEQRRIALQEALEENKRLCDELEEKKELCNKLEEVASQAEYFASLYNMVMAGETNELEDSDSNSPEHNDSRESNVDGDSDTP